MSNELRFEPPHYPTESDRDRKRRHNAQEYLPGARLTPRGRKVHRFACPECGMYWTAAQINSMSECPNCGGGLD